MCNLNYIISHFQVHADFEFYGGAVGLSACCLYGGSPYRPQEYALRRGVDIVIGTPGRIKVLSISFQFSKVMMCLFFFSTLNFQAFCDAGSSRAGNIKLEVVEISCS